MDSSDEEYHQSACAEEVIFVAAAAAQEAPVSRLNGERNKTKRAGRWIRRGWEEADGANTSSGVLSPFARLLLSSACTKICCS